MLPRLPVILVMWSSFAMSYVNINSADSPETALLLLKKLGVRFEHDSDGRLAVIDATDSRISDDDVGLLNLLPPPRSLCLHRTTITDRGLLSLTDMQSLSHLTLPKSISDRGIAGLARLGKLMHLELYYCKITEQGFRDVGKCANLKRLDLYGAQYGDAIESIPNKHSLEHLGLCYGGAVSSESIDKLSSYSNLTSLTLVGINLSSAGIRAIWKLQQLTDLNVVTLKADPEDWQGLLKMKRLRTVNLGLTNLPANVIGRLGELQELQSLSLFLVPNADDTSVSGLCKNSQLKYLNLSSTNISDASLPAITRLLSLECLELARTKVTYSNPGSLCDLKSLRMLVLSDTETSDAAIPILSSYSELHALRLSRTRITDAGLLKLGAIRELKELWVHETSTSLEVCDQLKAKIPGLVVYR